MENLGANRPIGGARRAPERLAPVHRKPVGSGHTPTHSGEITLPLESTGTLPTPYANPYIQRSAVDTSLFESDNLIPRDRNRGLRNSPIRPQGSSWTGQQPYGNPHEPPRSASSSPSEMFYDSVSAQGAKTDSTHRLSGSPRYDLSDGDNGSDGWTRQPQAAHVPPFIQSVSQKSTNPFVNSQGTLGVANSDPVSTSPVLSMRVPTSFRQEDASHQEPFDTSDHNAYHADVEDDGEEIEDDDEDDDNYEPPSSGAYLGNSRAEQKLRDAYAEYSRTIPPLNTHKHKEDDVRADPTHDEYHDPERTASPHSFQFDEGAYEERTHEPSPHQDAYDASIATHNFSYGPDDSRLVFEHSPERVSHEPFETNSILPEQVPTLNHHEIEANAPAPSITSFAAHQPITSQMEEDSYDSQTQPGYEQVAASVETPYPDNEFEHQMPKVPSIPNSLGENFAVDSHLARQRLSTETFRTTGAESGRSMQSQPQLPPTPGTAQTGTDVTDNASSINGGSIAPQMSQISEDSAGTQMPKSQGNDDKSEANLGIGTGSAYVRYLRTANGEAYSKKLPARLPIGVKSTPRNKTYGVPQEFLRKAMDIRYTHLQPRMLASEIDDEDEAPATQTAPEPLISGPSAVSTAGASTLTSATAGAEPPVEPGNTSRRYSSSTESVVEGVGRIKLFVANPDDSD